VSLVRALVLLHLSATTLLVVLFTAVLACQRVADVVRHRRAGRTSVPAAYPAEPAAPSAASVLDWSIDLRGPVRSEGSAVLQRTS
jgi:hypothetical protein